MFGYCGVADDKIHIGVAVSKKQNMFLIKMQCCVCVCVCVCGVQIPNPVHVGQGHLIHLTILFSLYVHKYFKLIQ